MKKMIFSPLLAFGLLLSCIPMPLQSSRGGWEGVKEGASSLYSYMPNVSEYMPSSPQWVTSIVNILSEHQKLILFTALAAVLGYTYKTYSYSQASQAEDQATREQAALSYSFKDNGTDFTLKTNATNIIIFLKVVDNNWAGIVGTVTPAESVKPEQLFKVFIYPVLEEISKDQLSAITSQQGHGNFWNSKIEAIKDFNQNPTMLLTKRNEYYLDILRQQLKEFIKNNNSPTAQEILNSLKQALHSF